MWWYIVVLRRIHNNIIQYYEKKEGMWKIGVRNLNTIKYFLGKKGQINLELKIGPKTPKIEFANVNFKLSYFFGAA